MSVVLSAHVVLSTKRLCLGVDNGFVCSSGLVDIHYIKNEIHVYVNTVCMCICVCGGGVRFGK